MSKHHAHTVRCACRQTKGDNGPKCRRGRGGREKAKTSARSGDATACQEAIYGTETKTPVKIFGLVGIGGSARLATLATHALVVMMVVAVGVTVAIMIEGMAGITVSKMMLGQVLSLARTDVEIGGRPYPSIMATTPRSCHRAVRLVRRGMRRGIMKLLRIIVMKLRLRWWSSTPRRQIVRVARRLVVAVLVVVVLPAC